MQVLSNIFVRFLSDARHFQIVFLSLFLTYGCVELQWLQYKAHYIVTLSLALFISWVNTFFNAPAQQWKSNLISALGICLLLHSNGIWVSALAIILAIYSKRLFRFRGKHIFNPANFGIIAVILITGEAWISPGQWGSSGVLAFFFGLAALMVLLKVGRLDISIYFFAVLAVLELGYKTFYLGWTGDVLLHYLSNGSLLLFTFFMITDPKTAPQHPRARILWSILLALGVFFVARVSYLSTAPMWVLFFMSPLNVLFQKIFPASEFKWTSSLPVHVQPQKTASQEVRSNQQNVKVIIQKTTVKSLKNRAMKNKAQWISRSLLFIFALQLSVPSFAFCGFYVAPAGSELYNDKSEVILVRNGNHTTVSMSNDFKGNVRDFAMVVPVPVVLQEHQIKVIDRSIFETLDKYSAPRLVEYYDQNPCAQYLRETIAKAENMPPMMVMEDMVELDMDYNVKIEARYEVGEYEIMLLSASESEGLQRWLEDNDYDIPKKAQEVLEPYIRSNMKFFVAKVNLNKMPSGEYLSPIQITYSSPKFMLPIRLGMANSKGAQDLIVYAFSAQGRVECTNYRTVKMPTNRNIPLSVEPVFGNFYKRVFDRAYEQNNRKAVFLEYAWDVSPQVNVKCDPCVGPPPITVDFQKAGVDWVNTSSKPNVFFTRLHVRYTRDRFPSDLQFHITPNQERFQCRYIMTHPATGDMSCEAGQEYMQRLGERQALEQEELNVLTGYSSKENRSLRQYLNEEMEYALPITGGENNSGPSGLNPVPFIQIVLGVIALIATVYQLKKERIGWKLAKN